MAKRKFKNVPSVGKLYHENPYMDFMEIIRNKVYSSETKLYIHHIIPIHDGGTDEKKNLISLSYQDHIEAHRIRFQVYGQIGDDLFIQLVEKNSEKVFLYQRQLGAKATHALLKNKNANRWNSEYQRQMSRFSVEKDNGARSRGGKIAGQKRWAGYIITPSDKYLFYYKSEPIVCIFNCNDGTQVLNILNTIIPNPNFTRASPLLTGERKIAYGWSCTKLN